MLNVDDKVKELFYNGTLQVAKLTLYTQQETHEITEKDITSLSIERTSVSGESLEIGNVSASQLEFTLKSKEGTIEDSKWNSVNFESAEVYAQIGVVDENNTTNWITLGYFIVDGSPRHLNQIEITALDRMVKFDKTFDAHNQLPMTISQLVKQACNTCGVSLETDLENMPNHNYIVHIVNEEYTWREILSYCCQLMACNAQINTDGNLVLKWYSDTDITIDASKRYSHELYENDVTVTGIRYLTEEDEIVAGLDAYSFDLSENPLLTLNIEGALVQMNNVLGGFTYRPYSVQCLAMPWVFPMDMMKYIDATGKEVQSIVTNITFTMNSNSMLMEGKGETEQNSSYANVSGLTAQQKVIIDSIKRRMSHVEEQSVELNRLVGNSLGLYDFRVTDDEGTKYYFGDAPTLEGSNIIYTFTANGFAWTTDWNSGNPVWTYGVTKDGNAILRAVSAAEISANQITGGVLRLGNYDNISGLLEVYDEKGTKVGQLDKDGLKMYGVNNNYILINTEVGFAGYDRKNKKIYWVDEDEFHQRKSVVEEEITIGNVIRMIPIITTSGRTATTRGIGFVSVENPAEDLDDYLMTESNDYLITEEGDYLLLE